MRGLLRKLLCYIVELTDFCPPPVKGGGFVVVEGFDQSVFIQSHQMSVRSISPPFVVMSPGHNFSIMFSVSFLKWQKSPVPSQAMHLCEHTNFGGIYE